MGIVHAILRIKSKVKSWFSGKILDDGELSYESDEKGLKIGNGSTDYEHLPYLLPPKNGVDNKFLKCNNGNVEWAEVPEHTQTDWEQDDNIQSDYLKNMPGVFRDPWHNTEGLPITVPDGTVIENVVQDYDGNWYNGVVMNNQIWLKENLRVTHNPSGNPITYYHANGDASNDETYGLLYNWNTIMDGASSSDTVPSGVQGIAPDGWHIPSRAELDNFAIYVGQQSQYILNNDSTCIAKALASKEGWDTSTTDYTPGKNPENNNLTNFSLYPAGKYSNGEYEDFSLVGSFFTCTEINQVNTNAYLISYSNKLLQKTYAKIFRSVRCICNTSATDYIAANRSRLYLKLTDSGMVWKQLSEVAESGSYNDLSDKPEISTVTFRFW